MVKAKFGWQATGADSQTSGSEAAASTKLEACDDCKFEAETQALAMMDHPHIAKIYEAGVAEEFGPYFAMEFCHGKPITRYCDEKRLSIPQRLELFQQICQAVQHAHQKGIIHRDIKPSNVLVAEADGVPSVKVIDFGLAKAMESQLKLTEKSIVTEIGQLIGTYKYMSPEQAAANPIDIDTRLTSIRWACCSTNCLLGQLQWTTLVCVARRWSRSFE